MCTEEARSPHVSSKAKASESSTVTDHLASNHDLLHVLVFLFNSRPCPSSLSSPSFHLFSIHRLAKISAQNSSPPLSNFDHREVTYRYHLDFEAGRFGIWLDEEMPTIRVWTSFRQFGLKGYSQWMYRAAAKEKSQLSNYGQLVRFTGYQRHGLANTDPAILSLSQLRLHRFSILAVPPAPLRPIVLTLSTSSNPFTKPTPFQVSFV